MEFSKRGVPRKIVETPTKKMSPVLPLCMDGLDSCVTGVRIGVEKNSSEVAFLSLTSAAGYVPPVHLPQGHQQSTNRTAGCYPSSSNPPQTPQTPDSGYFSNVSTPGSKDRDFTKLELSGAYSQIAEESESLLDDGSRNISEETCDEESIHDLDDGDMAGSSLDNHNNIGRRKARHFLSGSQPDIRLGTHGLNLSQHDIRIPGFTSQPGTPKVRSKVDLNDNNDEDDTESRHHRNDDLLVNGGRSDLEPVTPQLKGTPHSKCSEKSRNKLSIVSASPAEEPQDHSFSLRDSSMQNEMLSRAKYIVDRAVKNRKVFMMQGNDGRIRRILKRRGWIEKPHNPNRGNHRIHRKDENSNLDLDALIEKLLSGVTPNFIWSHQRNKLEWKRLRKDQIVNKFQHAHFTTKIGIHSALENLYWFTNNTMHSFFPRCYQVFIDEERKAFIDDYRATACMNVVKWFVNTVTEQGTKVAESRPGRVRRTLIEFSLARCEEYIKSRANLDLDAPPPVLWEHQWEQFLTEYYTLAQGGARIQEYYEGSKRSEEMLIHSKKILEKLRKLCPQLEMDGLLNMWIIKPGSSSRGRGISITNRLERILSMVNCKQSRFVVQKYIERPMLIYHTKFDIRQWVLVTDWNPLVIWMYKPSYLRFCSQAFQLDNFHESIHLCNNAIQNKYKNGERSSKLPEENMWDNETFIQYLSSCGMENSWDQIIYPGMKKCLIGCLLATQEMMENCTKKNCFELYGADFMLTQDLRPWLLEINSSPALGATTSTTARLCANVLEDVIKVTVDRQKNKNADTGGFEIIYRQQPVQQPQYSGIALTIQGSKLPSAPRHERLLIQDGLQYYNSPKLRISPTNDSLQALFAEAEILSKGNPTGNPRMVELIDTIMSIPSCLQDQHSKVQVVNKWLKERKMIEDNVMVGDENGLQPGQYPVEGTDASSLQAEGRAIRVAGAGVEGDSEEVLDELPSPFQAEMKYCTLDFIEDPAIEKENCDILQDILCTSAKKKGKRWKSIDSDSNGILMDQLNTTDKKQIIKQSSIKKRKFRPDSQGKKKCTKKTKGRSRKSAPTSAVSTTKQSEPGRTKKIINHITGISTKAGPPAAVSRPQPGLVQSGAREPSNFRFRSGSLPGRGCIRLSQQQINIRIHQHQTTSIQEVTTIRERKHSLATHTPQETPQPTEQQQQQQPEVEQEDRRKVEEPGECQPTQQQHRRSVQWSEAVTESESCKPSQPHKEPEHGQPEDSDQEQEPGQELRVGQEEKSGKVDRNWQDQESRISQADQQKHKFQIIQQQQQQQLEEQQQRDERVDQQPQEMQQPIAV